MEGTERWPLSAAATALLLRPRTSAREVLALSLRELVLVGAVRLTTVAVARRMMPAARLVVASPGSRAVPDRVPLPALAAALLPDGAVELPLHEAVAGALAREPGLPKRCRAQALEELRRRGLVRRERRLLWTSVVRTPAGEAWARHSGAEQQEWQDAFEAGGAEAEAALAAATTSPALVALLGRADRRVLDRRTGAAPLGGGDTGTRLPEGPDGDERVAWGDLHEVDGLDGTVAAVDAAVGGDGGGSGAGGGDGDGGGGGGGGD